VCAGSERAAAQEYKVNKLADFLSGTWGPFITSQVGLIVTGAVFLVLLVLSILGCIWIPVDFKLEWFIPDDSYVNQFYKLNDAHFNTGTGMNIYTKEGDYYAKQDQLLALNTYVRSTEYIDHTQPVTDWYQTFLEYIATTDYAAAAPDWTWGGKFDPATQKFTDSATFYEALSSFYSGSDGTRYRSSMSWTDRTCEDRDTWDACTWSLGLRASRMDATIQASKLTGGRDRYVCMVTMRKDIAAAMEGAFPYAREFSNWEEVGVIGTELLRNLLICGAVICVVVFTMIPDPKVSGWVILCILLSIVDVLGMLYWWDITINSITTIYVLISVGLAVDYAAHIAHMFKEAKGPAQSRACEALGRIGPCVLNAMISTFLAVLMLSFSKSYVFVTMFRAFCLVVIIAGAHGMWLLPVLLTLFGGDNGEADDAPEGKEAVEELENPSANGEEDLPPQKEAMD
jgi:Niemann-Pick C1 protein